MGCPARHPAAVLHSSRTAPSCRDSRLHLHPTAVDGALAAALHPTRTTTHRLEPPGSQHDCLGGHLRGDGHTDGMDPSDLHQPSRHSSRRDDGLLPLQDVDPEPSRPGLDGGPIPVQQLRCGGVLLHRESHFAQSVLHVRRRSRKNGHARWAPALPGCFCARDSSRLLLGAA